MQDYRSVHFKYAKRIVEKDRLKVTKRTQLPENRKEKAVFLNRKNLSQQNTKNRPSTSNRIFDLPHPHETCLKYMLWFNFSLVGIFLNQFNFYFPVLYSLL